MEEGDAHEIDNGWWNRRRWTTGTVSKARLANTGIIRVRERMHIMQGEEILIRYGRRYWDAIRDAPEETCTWTTRTWTGHREEVGTDGGTDSVCDDTGDDVGEPGHAERAHAGLRGMGSDSGGSDDDSNGWQRWWRGERRSREGESTQCVGHGQEWQWRRHGGEPGAAGAVSTARGEMTCSSGVHALGEQQGREIDERREKRQRQNIEPVTEGAVQEREEYSGELSRSRMHLAAAIGMDAEKRRKLTHAECVQGDPGIVAVDGGDGDSGTAVGGMGGRGVGAGSAQCAGIMQHERNSADASSAGQTRQAGRGQGRGRGRGRGRGGRTAARTEAASRGRRAASGAVAGRGTGLTGIGRRRPTIASLTEMAGVDTTLLSKPAPERKRKADRIAERMQGPPPKRPATSSRAPPVCTCSHT